MAVLKAEQVTKIYGTKSNLTYKALENIGLEIGEGEFVGVMGPSGSGKTTLLNILATIDKPTSGHIEINGTDPAALSGKQLALFRRRELGFIFQDFNLLATAVIAGHGVALCPVEVFRREIENGDLVILSDVATLEDESYFLITKLTRSKAAASFADWFAAIVYA